MYEDYVKPERKYELAMARIERIAEDAYANFLVARGLQAQGETKMAMQHLHQVESLDLALQAIVLEAEQYKAEEAPHEHDH